MSALGLGAVIETVNAGGSIVRIVALHGLSGESPVRL